jgi:ankyrin repeat protein
VRPELIHMDISANDEHRALHYAVLRRDIPMVRLLMQAGADARKGIFPHRDATSALAIARDREYDDVVSVIEEEERHRREDMSCPKATISPIQDQITAAISQGDSARVRQMIEAKPDLLRQISRNGGLLTLAVNHGGLEMVRLLLDLGADVDERILLEELEEPTESWGMPLWHAALAGRLDITKLLLDRGADPNANVYASGWPLRNAWNHPDDSVKKLLLERGAKPQPYMIAELHDTEEVARLLASDSSEELARELVWSAADHGCPEIIEMAIPRLLWPVNDAR